jgi:hypothetical protein
LVPNLPPVISGRQEFVGERTARCAHQIGVFNVPANQTSTYMNSCIGN